MTVQDNTEKEKAAGFVNMTDAEATAIPVEAAPAPAAAAAPQMVQVIAPADLKEGYTFEADVNGTRVPVIVPAGGVKKGQQFMVPMAASESQPTAPTGKWKDGLFNCFSHGVCHPHLCLSCWCRPLALAQVMTRMRLNWIGESGSVSQVAKTFRTVLTIFVAYLIVDQFLGILFYSLVPEEFGEAKENVYQAPDMPASALFVYHLQHVVQLLFAVYLLIATCRTRQAVRAQYNIPEESCVGCEDCCCAFWCGCCTTMQMMRHTADYDTYNATCCTETGLPAHVQTV